MTHKNRLILFVCFSVSVLTAVACIQGGFSRIAFENPLGPGQLPADIFKLHIHIAAEPLLLEMPTLGGSVQMRAGKKPTDPQGDFREMIRLYESDPSAHTSFAERIDYSAALLFAGRYSDAITALVQLEHDHPGQYATASNLGTAYELNGEVDKAMEWINAGISRNADSHEGTEWLHVAILQAKQKLKDDPNWLVQHSVLEGDEKRSRIVKEQALEYQLNERLYFIRENDLIMCDLMYQAALITEDVRKKAYFIKQAPRFGGIRDQAIKKLARL